MRRSIIGFLLAGALVAISSVSPTFAADGQWSVVKANRWYSAQPWLLGSNFVPSTAINELEMWQPETFDPATIDRELGWAEGLGMNTMRVFLHNLLWQQDPEGLLKRMDKLLEIADKHHIRMMFVLLDSVWDPYPKAGKQPDPKPYVHNSGWVQAPGADILKDRLRWKKEIEPYVKAVVGHFRNDKRVLMWDVMNEPDNDNPPYRAQELANKATLATALLEREWKWVRRAKPTQPLTSGVWKDDWSDPAKLSPTARFQLDHSDIITFHSYDRPDETERRIASLRRYHRPIVCTEYMARPRGSTFQAILPLLKRERVGAYNWGFVSGKSQTIYPWDSWDRSYTGPPLVWFHDIFQTDGTPYNPEETNLIRRLSHEDK